MRTNNKRGYWLMVVLVILMMIPISGDIVAREVTLLSDDLDITDCFTDENFRKVVMLYDRIYDGNQDGRINYKEVKDIEVLSAVGQNIESLAGIEYFTNLKTLMCSFNRITSLDLSYNTKLEGLSCTNNKLTYLDITQCTELTGVECYYNELTTVDISKNTKLKEFNCANNKISHLDPTKNVLLERLRCYKNRITALDVSQNEALITLYCDQNQIRALDVDQNSNLQEVIVYNNPITRFNFGRINNIYTWQEWFVAPVTNIYHDTFNLSEVTDVERILPGSITTTGCIYIEETSQVIVEDYQAGRLSYKYATQYDQGILSDSFVEVTLTFEVAPIDVPDEVYALTIEGSQGGTVSPSGTMIITEGSQLQVTVTPDEGYHIQSVVVDGVDIGAVTTYLFENIQGDHSFKVIFEQDQEIAPIDPGQGEGEEGKGETDQGEMDQGPLIPEDLIDQIEDVDETNWFKEAVAYVITIGVMDVTEESKFEPTMPTTRGGFVELLYHLEKEEASLGKVSFEDVSVEASYYPAIIWGVEKGIILGYDERTFIPDQEATRQELVTMLYRYARHKGYDVQFDGMEVEAFQDYETVYRYALPAMNWAVHKGVIRGRDTQVLDPCTWITRAECAQIMMHFMKNVALTNEAT